MVQSETTIQLAIHIQFYLLYITHLQNMPMHNGTSWILYHFLPVLQLQTWAEYYRFVINMNEFKAVLWWLWLSPWCSHLSCCTRPPPSRWGLSCQCGHSPPPPAPGSLSAPGYIMRTVHRGWSKLLVVYRSEGAITAVFQVTTELCTIQQFTV